MQSNIEDQDALVVLPLDKLVMLYYRHLQKQPTAEVRWEHRVMSIEHGDNEARIICETHDGKKTLSADYVLGCDGATSQIRRSLFGKEYPGETLHSQIIATNVSLMTKNLDRIGKGLTHSRSITIFTSSDTGIRTSSSIPRIGIWQRKSQKMACGE